MENRMAAGYDLCFVVGSHLFYYRVIVFCVWQFGPYSITLLIEYEDARVVLNATCLSPKAIQNGRMRNSSAGKLNGYFCVKQIEKNSWKRVESGLQWFQVV